MRHPSIWVIVEPHAKMKYKKDNKSSRKIQAQFMAAEHIPIVRTTSNKPIGRQQFRNDFVVGYFRDHGSVQDTLDRFSLLLRDAIFIASDK
uniref:AlNc14C346G10855 protein n=1 Tax=Albugo laibachii Nc14 TaxID=890382 RepID=F0WXA2_9STRA|nr:AlNc14C346G10855 [Albugo laibachii Nc14]|eukprot:CCA26094.1 AlNc14C346G10855 [Albugo laibachii Nc14]